MNGITKRLVLLLLLVCGLGLVQSKQEVCAQGIFAEDACDPDYYESLKARAWLEAQREITQNQNLIFKPDSVLEYTCFDSFLDHMALTTIERPLFSMSDRWGEPAGDIEASLSNVAAAAAGYDVSNFTLGVLGGRTEVPYDIRAEAASAPYGCNTMNEIWMVAKCMNFIQNPETDGFFTFQQYADSDDRRTLPTPCTELAAYQENLDIALLDPPWQEDAVFTYFEDVFPPIGSCGTEFSMLTTGLIINRANADPASYLERVCLVPGCHYVPASYEAGECILVENPE